MEDSNPVKEEEEDSATMNKIFEKGRPLTFPFLFLL